MNAMHDAEPADVVAYALRLGDDALIYAHRLAEWVTHAPELEEDVALANIGLDMLGQARTLLTYAGEREGRGRTEDDLAYLRDERQFTNVVLVEQPNGDFGEAMARLLVFSAYQYPLYERLSASMDETIAAVAAKAVKEVAYHRDHARQWVIRLGDGTPESHHRLTAGLERIWPYVDELFESDDLERRLVDAGVAVDRSTLREGWILFVREVLSEATLEWPDEPTFRGPGSSPGKDGRGTGGRSGVHTEPFGYLLAEMQHLVRSHPGAIW